MVDCELYIADFLLCHQGDTAHNVRPICIQEVICLFCLHRFVIDEIQNFLALPSGPNMLQHEPMLVLLGGRLLYKCLVDGYDVAIGLGASGVQVKIPVSLP